MKDTVENWHLNFVTEEYGEDGILKKFGLKYPDNFNYAYDIIDKFAELEPDRRALLWVDLHGNEKTLSFGDLSRMASRVANMFTAAGVKKGDHVMLVMKRHYQFWYTLYGLMKIGAVAIPASYLLTAHDYTYRFNAADVKAVVATHDGDVCKNIEEGEKSADHKLGSRFIVNGTREGWTNFDEEVEKYSDEFPRIDSSVRDIFLMYFTSGTTGNPKMAIHDYTITLAQIQNAKHWHKVIPNGLHLTVSDTGWA